MFFQFSCLINYSFKKNYVKRKRIWDRVIGIVAIRSRLEDEQMSVGLSL